MKRYPLYPGQVEWLLRLFVHAHQAFLDGQPVDQALSAAFRKNKQLGSKDRRFYSTAIFGLYRYWGWLADTCEQNPLMAMYYAYLFEGQLPAPWWAEKLGLNPDHLPLNGLDEKLAYWKTKKSKSKLNQLTPHFLPEFEPDTLAGLSVRPPVWLRVKPNSDLFNQLQSQDIKNKQHPQLPDAWEVLDPFDQHRYPGQVAIQDLSSQVVGHICAPKKKQHWLDYCAGAGGKALHLYSLMGETGQVTLTDTRKTALTEAKERTQAAGYKQILIHLIQDTTDPLVGKSFDGVLVDVPCSGSGTWHRSPWLRWQLGIKELLSLEQQQAELLDLAAHKVRPGGTLVYATCSLLESENQEITRSFLSTHPDFALAPFKNPLNQQETQGELTIQPQDELSNGMYICKMKRLE